MDNRAGWQSIVILSLVSVLAGTTAYFATKAYYLDQTAARQPAAGPTTQELPTATASPTPEVTPTTSAQASDASTPPLLTESDLLSRPTDRYQVVAGDTLFPIGQKHQLSWQTIARVNNLAEPYLLKIGQQLIIPSIEPKTKLATVTFTADQSRLAAAASSLTDTKNQWRLDPRSVAQVSHARVFGLTPADDYRLIEQDQAAGRASVQATRVVGEKVEHFLIHLTQPLRGQADLWVVAAVAEQAS